MDPNYVDRDWQDFSDLSDLLAELAREDADRSRPVEDRPDRDFNGPASDFRSGY